MRQHGRRFSNAASAAAELKPATRGAFWGYTPRPPQPPAVSFKRYTTKPTYPVNPCSIEFDDAKSDSRPRTTILHNYAGGCKTFCRAK
jgi:hypothetical protein